MKRHGHSNIKVDVRPHKKPKRTWKKMAMVGPTFQAEWPDGTVTRMTTHCDDEKLDLSRGVRLSWYAYQSRTKGQGLDTTIKDARFERDKKILKTYKDINVTDHGVDPFT